MTSGILNIGPDSVSGEEYVSRPCPHCQGVPTVKLTLEQWLTWQELSLATRGRRRRLAEAA